MRNIEQLTTDLHEGCTAPLLKAIELRRDVIEAQNEYQRLRHLGAGCQNIMGGTNQASILDSVTRAHRDWEKAQGVLSAHLSTLGDMDLAEFAVFLLMRSSAKVRKIESEVDGGIKIWMTGLEERAPKTANVLRVDNGGERRALLFVYGSASMWF
jgi:hypothetical protein